MFGENAGVLARILAFVLPLGLDTLAIAIALGLQGQRPLRPALLFAVFETTMPLIGIAIGRVVGLWFETPAAYLGGLILLAVGFHTVREARHRENEVQRFALDSVRGIILAGLGISIDEIAIGFPLGALRLPIVAVLGAIAVQSPAVGTSKWENHAHNGVTTRKCQKFERTKFGPFWALSVNSRRLSEWKTQRRVSGRRSKVKSVR